MSQSVQDEALSVGGDQVVVQATSEESDGALFAVEVHMAPGGGPPALHRHDPFELYRVERGELAFYVADAAGRVRRHTAGPGEVVAIPGGREHTIRNESGDEARAFVVFSPAGEMEGFVRGAAALAAAGRPGMDEVLALAARQGIELTRPLAEVA
jgi:oxalate decarboxylase/phosphoglucose isomerase-like protein (cupin superfamily)